VQCLSDYCVNKEISSDGKNTKMLRPRPKAVRPRPVLATVTLQMYIPSKLEVSMQDPLTDCLSISAI